MPAIRVPPPARQGWQERSGAAVIALAFCAALAQESPQKIRINRYVRTRGVISWLITRVCLS
jgi:hypothetical protein